MGKRIKLLMISSYLLVLVISLLIYLGVRYETEKKIRNLYIESQLTVMRQAITGIDDELETIKYFSLRLTQDPYVQLFSYVDDPLDRDDLEAAVKLVGNIRSHYTGNSFIEDYYIYYAKSGRIANSNSFYQAKHYYQQEWSCRDVTAAQWQAQITAAGSNGCHPVVVMTNGARQGEYIPYTYGFGSFADGEESVLVVLLKKDRLDEWLRDISAGGRTLIDIGAEMDRLLISDTADMPKELRTARVQWRDQEERWQTVTLAGKVYLATRLYSERTDWQYESLIPYETIVVQIKESTKPLLVGLLLYGMLGIPACFFLAFRSYKPIERIHKQYRELETRHDDTLQQYSLAADKIKKNRDRIQESILRQLLAGHWHQEPDISFPYQQYCVAAVRIENDRRQEPEWGSQEKSLDLFILKNVARELLVAVGEVYVLPDDTEHVSLLLNLSGDGCKGTRISPAVQALLEQFQDYLRTVLHIQISIGAGTVCSRYNELNSSYKLAKQALEYCFIMGDAAVIVYDDIKLPDKQKPYHFDKRIEKVLAHAISRRDISTCERTLDELQQEILKQRITVAEGRQLHIVLTDLAMNLIARSGVVGKTELDCQDLVGRMLACDMLPDTFVLMKKMLGCLCHEQAGSENGLGAAAVLLIKQNYQNSNLSLQFSADQLGVTPEHLSRTIRLETGRTFMEIVNHLRIEHAKALLQSSALKIEEIADLSGFGTAKSFFRSFKQAEGVSPGVWRSMNK